MGSPYQTSRPSSAYAAVHGVVTVGDFHVGREAALRSELPTGVLPAITPRVVVPRSIKLGVFLPAVHGVVIVGDFPVGHEAALRSELPAGALPAIAHHVVAPHAVV
jgi:hypothetical protein